MITTASRWPSRQRALAGLLESETHEEADVDDTMEAQTPFVGPDGAPHLHLDARFTWNPPLHPIDDDADSSIRFHQPLTALLIDVARPPDENRRQ
ncbi:MAG TPA: hypothetical protein VNC61_02785 [Acidimicrobiales bacterium]|nr:hypothetical protein [Acidimicrobiales bacterium]